MNLPARLRLTVTQWRILILCVNFVLAAVVLGQIGSRFLGGGRRDDGGKIRQLLKTPPRNFAPSKHGGGTTSGDDPIRAISGLATFFNKLPEEPVAADPSLTQPPPDDTDITDEDFVLNPDGEEVYNNGPLTDLFEFVSCIYFGTPDHEFNRAVLRPKQGSGAATPSHTRPRPSSRETIDANKKKTSQQRARERAQKARENRRRQKLKRRKKKGNSRGVTLINYQEWTIHEGTEEEAQVAIHSISPQELHYRDADRKLYSLKRKSESLYQVSENGEKKLAPPKDEEEEQEGEEAKEEEIEKKHFILGAPATRRHQYNEFIAGERDLKKPKESEVDASASASASGPKSTDPAPTRGPDRRPSHSQPIRKKPTRAELKKATESLKAIEKSDKFKKLGAKERKDLKKLQKLLGGRK